MRPLVLIAALLLSGSGPVSGQATPVPGGPAPRQPPTASFDDVTRRAAEARQADRADEALRLYRQAVGMRQSWDEGWWYLGALAYELDRYEEARKALRRFVELKPNSGPGWALLGLCDFEAGDHAAARRSLEKAVALEIPGNRELLRAAQLRLALAYVKGGQPELAMEPLTWLARSNEESPALDEAIGLNLLRLPLLPSEVPEERRDLVRRIGRAGFLFLATREREGEAAFAEVIQAYPDVAWVHYARGSFLKKVDSERALAEFRRELEVQPTNVYANLEIAFELLLRGDYAGAGEAAERAAGLAPDLFAARYALGRALVGLGQVDRGITELEAAARLAPDVPEMYFALAQAYARAGRTEDVARARARFLELKSEREARRGPGTEFPVPPPQP